MTEFEIAWLAGLLEGEGSFILYSWKGRPKYHCPRIQLTMTDKDVIEKVSNLLSTTLYGPYKYGVSKKETYQIQVNGKAAIPILEKILPYMGERRSIKIKGLLTYKDTYAD